MTAAWSPRRESADPEAVALDASMEASFEVAALLSSFQARKTDLAADWQHGGPGTEEGATLCAATALSSASSSPSNTPGPVPRLPSRCGTVARYALVGAQPPGVVFP